MSNTISGHCAPPQTSGRQCVLRLPSLRRRTFADDRNLSRKKSAHCEGETSESSSKNAADGRIQPGADTFYDLCERGLGPSLSSQWAHGSAESACVRRCLGHPRLERCLESAIGRASALDCCRVHP